MANKNSILFWFLAVAFITSPLPQANAQAKEKSADAQIGGFWKLTFAKNKDEADLTIGQDKQTLKVTLKLMAMATLTGTGTIKGDVAEWVVSISSPRRTLTWIFDAKIEGDTLTGEVRMGEASTTKWTAIRKQLP